MSHTFIAMTYNLWGDWDLDRRLDPMRAFLSQRRPDLLGVQELDPRSRDAIDDVLTHHARVHDESSPWSHRSNLWWDTRKFRALEHGFSDVGMTKGAIDRGLHWVRLESVLDETMPSLIFASAHLTSASHKTELETHVTPRIAQADAIAHELNRLAGDDAASLLCTDLNDSAVPMWKLYDQGLREPYGYFGQHSPPTYPILPRRERPQQWDRVESTAKAIDWLFFGGPIEPRLVEVSDFFLDGVAPSDHKPVSAAFTLR